MARFTHIDEEGNARMVDVGQKAVTQRRATATGTITMSPACFDAVVQGTVKKGDVLTIAQVAGIMGAKETSRLIPLCHLLQLTKATLTFSLCDATHSITACCTTQCDGKTGVEMEALTGVSIALLTIYDMCKAIDKAMTMGDIHLVEKEGGKSGHFVYEGVHRDD